MPGYQRVAVLAAVLGAIVATALVRSPFVHASPLEHSGPRSAVNLRYSARPNQLLDLSLPDAGKYVGPRPVIVWLHAGGWEYGTRRDPAPFADYELKRGYAIAKVEYGLSPEFHFPTPVHDVKLAIRWLKANARKYGLDASRVIVAGYSAGAQLAALIATTPGTLEPKFIPTALAKVDDSVAGAIAISGGYDFVALTHSQNLWAREATSALLGCKDPGLPAPLKCPAGSAAAATVRNHLGPQSPAFFVVHGREDELFLRSQQEQPLAWSWLQARGGRGVSEQIVDSGHGIELNQIDLPRVDRFLSNLAPNRLTLQLH